MRTYLFLAIFSLLSAGLATARTPAASVSGKVIDEAGKPLTFASILLLRSTDSSLVRSEMTNEKGEFVLTPIPTGDYLVKVMLMGYTTYRSGAITIAGSDISLPVITLQQDSKNLKEVTVSSQKPFVEVHADKLVVNVENSIVGSGGSVLDVLSHSPGVNVDQNDNVSLKGKQGVNIMINGKTQPISGQDLANLLKSMPSSSIETIELISNPSAKYDAAGTAGIINIKMKKDKRKGLNGSVNGNYAQGVYGKASGGFNLNYRNKRVNVFASYNHGSREGFNHLTLQRNFYNNETFAGAYNQDNNYLYHIYNDMASLGADYNLSSKTILGAVVSGDATNFRRDGYNYSDVIDSATQQPLSHFSTANSSPNHWNNLSVNLNLRHTFDSTGRSLNADIDYSTYPSTGLQHYITSFFDSAGNMISPVPQVLHGDLRGLTQIQSVKADYTHPLKNDIKIEAGFKVSYVTADNDLHFYNLVNGTYITDPGKTFHFIYTENINAAYINFNKDWPKWSTQIGLRGEQTVVKGDDRTSDSVFNRNYIQPFPSVAVQRHIDKDNDLGLTVSRRIARPNYEQLNPFKYYLDPTTYKAGYPYLNPALAYSAELSYIYKQRLITTFTYSYTTDPITEVIQPSPTEAKVTIQTAKNLISSAYYGINGSYQFRFFKWWNNMTNINAYYVNYTGDIAGTNLNDGSTAFDIYTSNSFLFPKNWSAEVTGYYQAPMVYGYMHLKPQSMIGLGIQKNLFDKRLTVKLNATDIFWTGYPKATSYYNNYIESFVAQRDTRQVSLSVTYRFGKRTIPQASRHNGGAEDEKKRAGSQGA